MNLYLTGAGGTGKTTTGDLLAERLHMQRTGSVSRSSPHKVGTDEHQDWVGEQIYNQCAQPGNVIYDRTPFDVCAYNVAFDKGSHAKASWRANFFATWSPTVIYFPLYWLPEDDGFRPTDETVARIVDVQIKKQLDFFKLDYYTVLNESPEDRVKHILEWLKERGGDFAAVHV